VLDTGFNFEGAFTLISILTAWTLFNVAAFGTDQDMVQRMLTCRGTICEQFKYLQVRAPAQSSGIILK
jgi:hypothetical protein